MLVPMQQKREMKEELVICSESQKCISQLAPDVYSINFSFSDGEKSQLLNYGFKDEKILDENHC